LFIKPEIDDRNALAFLKWVESNWTQDELPTEVLHFLAIEDSVVRR
jgi:hypothetical protein